jgi:fructose-1,6-bisphosphatase/inositol monophosphatase family enzyme
MWGALSLLMANEAGGAIRRQIRSLAFTAMAGVVGLIALIYVLSGLYEWLATFWAPHLAAWAIAAGLLIIAGILLVVARNAKAKPNEPASFSKKALIATPVVAKLVGGPGRMGTLAVGGVVIAVALATRYLASRSSED